MSAHAGLAADWRLVASQAEIAALVEEQAPALLELKGCGVLTAAKLIAETAGAGRLSSDAKFARLAGVAPVPTSSGKRTRYRLDRGGNRQLNCALHRIAVCQGRVHPPAREFLERKQAEGKSRLEALRCLKRHLARRREARRHRRLRRWLDIGATAYPCAFEFARVFSVTQ